jgi:hypothetical protein
VISKTYREEPVETTKGFSKLSERAAFPDDIRHARASVKLEDMVVRNPSPDASPSRQPSGKYRIIESAR